MPCPFRVALTVLTVALGGILFMFHFAWTESPEDEKKRAEALQSTADEPETRCPYTKSVRWVRRTSMSLASYTPFAAAVGLTPDASTAVPVPFSQRSLKYRVSYILGVVLLVALHVELILGPTPVAHAARHWVRATFPSAMAAAAAMGDKTAVAAV